MSEQRRTAALEGGWRRAHGGQRAQLQRGGPGRQHRPGGPQGRQDSPHQAVPLRLEVRPQALAHGGPRQDLRGQHEVPHPSLHPGLQEPHRLAQPGDVSAQARGLGSERRAGLHRPRRTQRAEPRQEQVRAHNLGRGHRPGRGRDTARGEGVRLQRHLLPARRSRRGQGGACRPRLQPPPAVAHGRGHHTDPQPRQLGRLVLGRQARVGQRAGGQGGLSVEHHPRHSRAHADAALPGLRPRDHHLGLGRADRESALLLVHRAGHQADLHLSGRELRRGRARRQVDTHTAQHRRRPQPGHRLPVDNRGHLRQGVRRDPRGGLRQVV